MVNLYANAMRGEVVPPGATENCTCQMSSAPRRLMWEPEDDCPDHAPKTNCPCADGELEVCHECGLPAGEGECEDEPCEMRPATDYEKAEFRPFQECRQHGWCDGCTSPNCEDCGG